MQWLEFLALKLESRILRQSSNPVSGFSMMEQVRLCAVWPMENWLGSSLNQTQGWTTFRESYSRALEQGPLAMATSFCSRVIEAHSVGFTFQSYFSIQPTNEGEPTFPSPKSPARTTSELISSSPKVWERREGKRWMDHSGYRLMH